MNKVKFNGKRENEDKANRLFISSAFLKFYYSRLSYFQY